MMVVDKKGGSMLRGKEIILGVTGGIAAYKSVELLRELTRRGSNVHVVMTKNATQFVTPLTFQTLSGNPVISDLFKLLEGSKIGHIALADVAQLLVIAPATANIIGKIANGIADDFLTTMVMATRVPVLFAPSMNTKMWESPFVQQNIEKLKSFGYQFIGPQIGDLACGSKGRGRIADIEDIVEKMEDIFTKKDLKGYKFIITSGPTHEAIDPVRYITNRSTGKMGYALAITAKRRGAEVILIAGQSYLPPPTNDMKVIRVFTAKEMRDKVIENFKWCDAVIKAAAVADFRPSTIQNEKIKKEGGKYFLELEKNPDILKELGEIKKEHQILVGFAAETSRHIDNAIKKLKEKKLDLIIANDVTLEGAGFGYDTNIVDIIDATGKVKSLPLMSKMEIANIILDQILRIFKKKGREKPWPQIW